MYNYDNSLMVTSEYNETFMRKKNVSSSILKFIKKF